MLDVVHGAQEDMKILLECMVSCPKNMYGSEPAKEVHLFTSASINNDRCWSPGMESGALADLPPSPSRNSPHGNFWHQASHPRISIPVKRVEVPNGGEQRSIHC